MASRIKTLQKLTKANLMADLYASFIPRARDKRESAEYYRLQCRWLRKAEAIGARLKSMRSRKGVS